MKKTWMGVILTAGAACLMIGCSKEGLGEKNGFEESREAPNLLETSGEEPVLPDGGQAPPSSAELEIPDGEGVFEELPKRESECEAVDFSLTRLLNQDEGEFLFTMTPGHEGELWYYDEFYHLEKYVDGEWTKLEMKVGLCGNTSYFETEGEDSALELDWGFLYGGQDTGEPLEPGIYCVAKEVFPEKGSPQKEGPKVEAGQTVYAVFELKDRLDLELEIKDVKATGASFAFVQGDGEPAGELQYGDAYWLERLEGDGWVPVDHLESAGEMGWHDIAYEIAKGEPRFCEVDWSWLYGELAPGDYRFCKTVNDIWAAGDYDTYEYRAQFAIEAPDIGHE